MTVLLLVFATVLGLVIGSFLNVVIWRVPRGESVVSPPSACPRCHEPISPRDNIPVLSWLILRGRCRHCGESISWQYPVVEAATAVLFALTALIVGLEWTLPAFLYLAALAVVLTVIDVQQWRLPDRIVLPSYPVVGGLLLLAAVGTGQWGDAARSLGAAVALFAFYYLLGFIYPAGMGDGDIKLSGILGAYLGWVSWAVVIVGGFAGFVLGALVGIAVIVSRRGGRKSKLPFGPFMIAGTYVGLLWGDPIGAWYLGIALG